MTTNADAYEGMVDAIIADNSLTRADAGDVIEGFGPTMPGTAARQWIDAIATHYESLGIINNPTYSSLRSEIVNEGKDKSMALFNAMASAINLMAETFPINEAIQLQSNADTKATIPGNIAILEGHKTAGVNQQLDDALQAGIDALTQLDHSIP